MASMSKDYAKYWDLTESDSFGTEVYFSRVNDGTESDHLPIDNNRSSGSLAISNNTTFRWSQNNKAWEEM